MSATQPSCILSEHFSGVAGASQTERMAEFQQAHAEFLAQLSDEEKKQFIAINDSQSFLAAVQDLQQFRKSNRKWDKLLTCVQRCGDCLQPYFEVVGTVIQSHPEVAAIAWGSFRLVLLVREPIYLNHSEIVIDEYQLASNFGTFFDKLGHIFEELSKRIPAYNEISQLLAKTKVQTQISDRFLGSLRAFYIDLYEFFRSVTRVFSQKNGSTSILKRIILIY
jgi:hypothetical protein